MLSRASLWAHGPAPWEVLMSLGASRAIERGNNPHRSAACGSADNALGVAYQRQQC